MSKLPLRQLLKQIYAAEKKYTDAIAARFKPGMRVHVTHGYGRTYRQTPADVVSTGGRDVTVLSYTGKQYSVDAYRLLEFRTR